MYQIKEITHNGGVLYSKEFADTLAVQNLLSSDLSYVERVYKFEEYLKQFPQIDMNPAHEFIDGMCKRTVVFEEGTLATGKVHIKDHMDVMLEGEMLVATEDGFKHLVAPCTMTTKAGTKKAGIALKRTVWVSYHPTNAKSGEELEKEMVIDYDYSSYLDVLSYREVLSELQMSEEEVTSQVLNTSDLVKFNELKYVEIRESNIQGKGLFSTSTFSSGQTICEARIGRFRTPAGRYTNHSANPNCKMIKDKDNILLVSNRDIASGEELTVCYLKTIRGLTCQQ